MPRAKSSYALGVTPPVPRAKNSSLVALGDTPPVERYQSSAATALKEAREAARARPETRVLRFSMIVLQFRLG